MDGMLSQEEINALFSGMDLDDEPANAVDATSDAGASEELLTPEEKDAIGEISNISLGSSATTLFSLVNQRVNISTPTVSVCKWEELSQQYDRPCVFIQISYKEGLDGRNVLILKENDVKIIADLMMGGDGSNTDGELNDMHLSAISEAMNQMMGASSTSLSTMFEMKIDISPPSASLVDLNDVVSCGVNGGDIDLFLKNEFVKVSFRMEIGNLIDSELIQMYPIDFARSLYRKFINDEAAVASAPAPAAPAPEAKPAPQPAPVPQQAAAPMQDLNMMAMGMQGMMQPQMAMPYAMPPVQDVNIAPAQFQAFQPVQSPLLQTENIDLLLDVPLEVTVELGRTSKSIKEILDFAPGTIVELNRLAGEPIDVLVNGKYVAKGEVVVIDEAFGIRVTEVIK
ncbi:MAG: flagellar motor switch phosphatase FliY [Lachnospiraceae bacterium]|nr:flagellar motor switch phosphatase FliY [Lachnospiraceae bacterium]